LRLEIRDILFELSLTIRSTAFQTAVALAVYEAGNNKSKPILQEKHLKQVVRMSKAFKEYIKSTRDLDEAEMARELKIRDNYLSRN